jgi:hypothetical protein
VLVRLDCDIVGMFIIWFCTTVEFSVQIKNQDLIITKKLSFVQYLYFCQVWFQWKTHVSSVLLRYTDSDYPFGIFKLFSECAVFEWKWRCAWVFLSFVYRYISIGDPVITGVGLEPRHMYVSVQALCVVLCWSHGQYNSRVIACPYRS